MPEFEIAPNRLVGENNPCFIIAECGQNHQGDINIAMDMIYKVAHEIKADCVKFQKSDLNKKFNYKALNRPYLSQHSWGSTYGQHKTHLEFTDEQFHNLQLYALNQGIIFASSAMDINSIEFLVQMDLPFLKIGSGDVNNFPLLQVAASKNKPLIISTGMHDIHVIQQSYSLVSSINSKIGLLHCVSSYPTPFEEINLKVLTDYQNRFPLAVIGYSSHDQGNEVSIGAVALGAKIIEKHYTLDKSMKGTDHSSSLNTNQFCNLVNQIRNVEQALKGTGIKQRCECEASCYKKLGKSIVSSKYLLKGTQITHDSIDIKVTEPFGIEAHEINKIIGKKLKNDIGFDESIEYEDLED